MLTKFSLIVAPQWPYHGKRYAQIFPTNSHPPSGHPSHPTGGANSGNAGGNASGPPIQQHAPPPPYEEDPNAQAAAAAAAASAARSVYMYPYPQYAYHGQVGFPFGFSFLGYLHLFEHPRYSRTLTLTSFGLIIRYVRHADVFMLACDGSWSTWGGIYASSFHATCILSSWYASSKWYVDNSLHYVYSDILLCI